MTPTVVLQESVTPFDVDGTLVLPKNDSSSGALIRIEDPVTGGMITMKKHEPMIRLLREAKQRGSYVIVWSRGGREWAHNVVTALELNKEVDLIMCKPTVYFDDRHVSEWLPDRVFIDPNVNYKRDTE